MRGRAITVIVLFMVGLELSVVGALFAAALGSVSPGRASLVILARQDPNPLRSSLPEGLGLVLSRIPGVREVSPEVLIFTVIRGEDVVLRGMNPEHLVRGDGARVYGGAEGDHWILAGVGAFRRLSLRLGETLVVPSSFSPQVWIGTITGVFETGTSLDSELVVPLDAARFMASLPGDRVTLFRLWTDGALPPGLVLPTRLPERVSLIKGEPEVLELGFISLSGKRENVTVSVMVGEKSVWKHHLTLDPGETSKLQAEITLNESGELPGRLEISNGLGFSMNFTVFEGRLEVRAPREVKLGEGFEVRVTSGGVPMEGALITFEGESFRTNESGIAEVWASRAGLEPIVAELEGYMPATALVNVTYYGGKGDPLSDLRWNGTRIGNRLIVSDLAPIMVPSAVKVLEIDGALVESRILDPRTLSPGPHEVRLLWESVGLVYSGNFTLVVDRGPPRIRLKPENGGYVTDSGGFLEARDDSIITTIVVEKLGVWYVGSSHASIAIPPGSWHVRVRDLVGRGVEFNLTYRRIGDDRFPPEITVHPGDGLTVEVQDDWRVDSVTLTVSGPGFSRSWRWEPFSRHFSTHLKPGALPAYGTVSVLAVDATGKHSSRSITAFLGGGEPDLEPPRIDVERTDEGITVSASDPSGVLFLNVSIDGHPLVNLTGGGPYSVSLSGLGPGNHVVVVSSEDGAGNVAVKRFNLTVSPDVLEIRPIRLEMSSDFYFEDSNVEVEIELWSSGDLVLNASYTLDGVPYSVQLPLKKGENRIALDLGRMGVGYHRFSFMGMEASIFVVPRRSVYLDLAGSAARIRFSGSDKGLLTTAVRASALSGITIMGTLSALSFASGLMAVRAVHGRVAEAVRLRAWLYHALGLGRREAWRRAIGPFLVDFLISTVLALLLSLATFFLVASWLSFFGYPMSMIGALVGAAAILFLAVWSIFRHLRWWG